MHRKERKIFLWIVIGVLILTGCWDKVEIEDRAFMALIGIDKFEAASGGKQPVVSSEGDGFSQINRYTISYAYPNTGLLAQKVEGEPKFIYVSTGEDLFSARESLNTRLGKEVFLRHLKAIVLGEELVRDKELFREVLDRIDRSPEIGRKLNLMITPGLAKEVLDTSTKDEGVLGLFIRDLMQRARRRARIPDADFGYILSSLHESNVAVIPRIISSKNELKAAGAGVIRDFQLVGWLGELETNVLMLMMDRVSLSTVDVEMDNLILPLHITRAKTKMKAFEKDGEIVVRLEIKMQADLKRHLFQRFGETDSNAYYKRLQEEASRMLEHQIISLYKKIQKEFGADLLQVGEYLRKHEPDLWEKVKGNWDEVYRTTKVEADVDFKIMRLGITM